MIKITSETLPRFQKFLQERELDGWLLYDFHHLNPFAYLFLPLDEGMFTRRWFYFLPAKGAPQMMVHRIEQDFFAHLAGERHPYSGWRELESGLGDLLQGSRKIAMEYSPGGALPYVSMVDAGTLELVRTTGVEVVSSADIIQYFHSRWTPDGYRIHKATVPLVNEIRENAFRDIARALRDGEAIPDVSDRYESNLSLGIAGSQADELSCRLLLRRKTFAFGSCPWSSFRPLASVWYFVVSRKDCPRDSFRHFTAIVFPSGLL